MNKAELVARVAQRSGQPVEQTSKLEVLIETSKGGVPMDAVPEEVVLLPCEVLFRIGSRWLRLQVLGQEGDKAGA